MNRQKTLLENNEVLLWGIKQIDKNLLKDYDTGNKNPHSLLRKGKSKEVDVKKPKVEKKKVFEVGEDYGISDLPFLNDEYDRIDKELSKTNITMEEMDELMDLQEKLADIIEGLEHFKKISGKNIKPSVEVSSLLDDDFIGSSIMKGVKKLIGKGFKKGSPEALAHAEKMRKALEAKKTPKIVKSSVSSRARVVKGSEEAKELGRRLAEARKAKKPQKEIIEEVKKPSKGKPWFYIGDIPKGYREAFEDEAILAGKVSEYGKYTVDGEKYRLYKDFNIFLTEAKDNREVGWSMSGLKKRIMKSLEEIEILRLKVDNPKYSDKKADFESKLEEEKYKRKILQAGWNWYNKLLSSRLGKPYVRQKFELPVKEIKYSNEKIEYVPPKRPIDPRTGKEAEPYFPVENKKEEKKIGVVDVDLYFENGTDMITLSTKYFTEDYKLKPKYVKKLLDKNIVLQKKHYTTDDYNKYFFKMLGSGIYKQLGKGFVNKIN